MSLGGEEFDIIMNYVVPMHTSTDRILCTLNQVETHQILLQQLTFAAICLVQNYWPTVPLQHTQQKYIYLYIH